VEAYEVTGAGTVRTRLQAAVARGLTRFVGRDEEMEQLRRAVEHARDGHGNVVAVVGEAGVGKSRLFYELTHSHRLQDWLVLEASSVSYGKATSYLPLIDLLRAYFRIEDRDDDRSRREKVMGKLLALDDALRPALAPVLSLLDVAVEDAEWAALDPIQRRQQIRESIRRLVMRESRVQPVAVVFEDLHWIDAETQAVLDNLVESLAGARMLLLVNYRPEYRDAWAGKSFYRLLRIDPLPVASVEELLRPLLGDDPALDGLKRLLAERTEGNPLFLEESVRTLVETGALVGERGSYRLAREAGALHVPPTVQAILAARIDRLGAEDKALLQAAAVLGPDVPYALLEPIAGLPPDALATALRRLQAAEFLYEARLFPDLEYTFKHALTHEVAYGSFLHERRRAMHERIVHTLERLYPDRVGEHVEQLAHHAFRGGLWAKAVTYLSDAGAKALRSSANVAARGLLEQALSAFGRLASDQQTPDTAFGLYLRLRHALLQLGEFDRMLEVLRDARSIAERAGDERRVGWTLAHMGEALRADARYQEALDTAGRALEIARRCDDVLLEHQARFHLGSAYLALGDFGRATEVLEPNGRRSAIELFLSGDLTAPIPASIGLRGAAFAQTGDFTNGLTLAEQSAQLGAQTGRPLHQVTGWAWAGAIYLQHGDYERALVFYERATDLARRYDIFFLLDRVTTGLACALAMAGRADEARVILRDGSRQSYEGSWLQPALTEVVRADAYLHAGQARDAREAALRAFALARDRGERPSEARARVAIGRAALSGSGDDAEAESHYREALAIAGDLGLRQLEAHVHLDFGTLRRRQGRLDEARAHLTAATTMYREMAMTYWLEKAEADAAAG
jgi:tetratricopeptide (TPR) repeat protein